MSEKGIFFDTGELKTEGLLDERPGEKGVVITHPHPLYGGDLYNNVVTALRDAYSESGYTTLRFNFRGVGRSQGVYGDGVGEQDDVEAALTFISALGKGVIDLAGYSFGAWVIALGLKRFSRADRVVMVSPPVDFMDFSFLGGDPRIKLVVAGSRDEFGRPDSIQKMVEGWNGDARLKTIAGADHFYRDKTSELKAIIRELLRKEDSLPA